MGQEVGRILQSSTTQFTAGCRILLRDIPSFGSFVKVNAQDGSRIYGLIYNVAIQDDPMVRQLIVSPELADEYMKDQRENRQVPVELSVLVVGYERDGVIRQELPPQPPVTLSPVETCDDEEIREFARTGFDFIRTILNAPNIPAEEVLVVALRRAAQTQGSAGRQFLLEAGRELAKLLSQDMVRLEAILRKLRVL
ncbi:MAG TPA: hypothetical protein ENG33_00445 [Chloroflexi bacterium]|nr:hypothetical protein [Chloroflexota bacterium]